MTADKSYRIEVAACPRHPGYYRWTVLQDGRPLDLPGFAYASAWSAREAAAVALHWHLALKPPPARPDADALPPASDGKRAAA